MGCLEKLKGCSVVGVSRDTCFIGLCFATCVKRRVISVCENMCLICDN